MEFVSFTYLNSEDNFILFASSQHVEKKFLHAMPTWNQVLLELLEPNQTSLKLLHDDFKKTRLNTFPHRHRTKLMSNHRVLPTQWRRKRVWVGGSRTFRRHLCAWKGYPQNRQH